MYQVYQLLKQVEFCLNPYCVGPISRSRFSSNSCCVCQPCVEFLLNQKHFNINDVRYKDIGIFPDKKWAEKGLYTGYWWIENATNITERGIKEASFFCPAFRRSSLIGWFIPQLIIINNNKVNIPYKGIEFNSEECVYIL